RVIFEELCLGQFLESSRKEYLRIVEELRQEGAQAVILGCTEIGLLVRKEDTDLPVFDTTVIHVQEALKAALGE
ncbi:MAG: aspartate/glutamate racemase family protein, partial [Oscillospiraceae bacterium]|nr:aspartate/glutamate racemase family protein [Oscillospiraceae bacterium]